MQTTVARSHAALLATPARRSSSRQALAGGTGCSRASRRRPQQQGAVCLAPAAFLAAGSVAPTASLVAGGLQAVAWASALIMAGRLYLQQQSQPDDGPRQECDTCHGSGTVECWCSRWSDDDRGCSTCRGSGRMVCSSCRGGGTAVPIEARLIIRKDQRTDNFRHYK